MEADILTISVFTVEWEGPEAVEERSINPALLQVQVHDTPPKAKNTRKQQELEDLEESSDDGSGDEYVEVEKGKGKVSNAAI